MGIISRLVTRAAIGAVIDSIEQSSNQNSPYYGNSPGGFVVCTNCAFTIEGGMPSCPRCGAPATAYYQQTPQQPMPNMVAQQSAAPAPNMQPEPQSLGFCGSCGAARTNPGPCAYCGK